MAASLTTGGRAPPATRSIRASAARHSVRPASLAPLLGLSSTSSVALTGQSLAVGYAAKQAPRAAGGAGGMRITCVQAAGVDAGFESWFPDMKLPMHEFDASGKKGKTVDLVIAGGGPAGLSVAERCSAAGLSVCVVDPEPLGVWPNNYGVWMDEFEAMGLEDTIETVWPRAAVQLDSGSEHSRNLDRPYGRVDRKKLKKKILDKCIANGVTFALKKVKDAQHGGGGSEVRMQDGSSIRGTLVLDATGHARRLVEFDKEFNPGYQGAYGIMAEVESHPFDLDTMLFMDWRDDHLAGHPEVSRRNQDLPTFLYVMPFSPTRVFLEETSLVARPAVPFDDLKERLAIRLKHLGVEVKSIEEEEFCLIPMGGVLPKFPQRVLGVGGTGGLVHPSTGYMVARTMAAVPSLADTIVEELSLARTRARTEAGISDPEAPVELSDAAVDAISAKVWGTLWPEERLAQREFFLFGMDVLLTLSLDETREFFTAFFALSSFHWHGFLSSRLSFQELIVFGLYLFKESSNKSRANLVGKGVPGLGKMLYRLAKYNTTGEI